jgi:hypothetical protein
MSCFGGSNENCFESNKDEKCTLGITGKGKGIVLPVLS